MKRKLRSRVVDGEGIETEEKKLIENGFLKFFFNCLSTAKQIKEDPSGHGTRYVASIPSASYTNLYLKNGHAHRGPMHLAQNRPAANFKRSKNCERLLNRNFTICF